jgi:hypothetical protein
MNLGECKLAILSFAFEFKHEDSQMKRRTSGGISRSVRGCESRRMDSDGSDEERR